jgi:uncharacterized coiled-coil protein SlyX
MDDMTKEEFELLKRLLLLELRRASKAETMEEVQAIIKELTETIESK